MTQIVMRVDNYVGRHKGRVGLMLLAAALVAAGIGAWGVSLRDVLHALP